MMGKLMRASHADLSQVLLVHRFGVVQGDDTKKVRLIDNFQSNSANSYAFSWESVTNGREDVVSATVLELQRALAVAGHEVDVQIGLEDFVGAFKTLPPQEEQRWLLWVLVWNPEEGAWYAGELQTLPFGALGSVLGWWRIAQAQKLIMRRLFRILLVVCG